MRPARISGLLGYVVITMWFLLTILVPHKAVAQNNKAIQISRIKISDLIPQIEDALIAKGAPREATAIIKYPEQELNVLSGQDPSFTSVSFSKHSGRFLIRVQGAPNTQSVAIAGSIAVVQTLPVLNRTIERGEIIKNEDLNWIETQSFVAPIFLRDSEIVVGKAAKRSLVPNRPLRKTDFENATLVKKGASVTMIIDRPGIRLTHTGIAKNNGAMGDVIAIENIASDRILKAIVIGQNTATVPGNNIPVTKTSFLSE